MSRWDSDSDRFQIHVDDWNDSLEVAGAMEVSIASWGGVNISLSFPDPSNDQWQINTLKTTFCVWPHELLNLMQYLESHPNFKQAQRSYDERYSYDEPYKTRAELQSEIDELKLRMLELEGTND